MSVGRAVPLLALAGLLAASLLTSWRDSYPPVPPPSTEEVGAPVVGEAPQEGAGDGGQPAPTPTVPASESAPAASPAADPTITPGSAPDAGPATGGSGGGQPDTPSPGPVPSASAPAPTPSAGGVDVSLHIQESRLVVGQRFTLEVRVHARPGQEVDAAQVYLDFAPTVLEALGVQGGGRLPYALQSGFDNEAGTVEYAAGTLGDGADTPFGLVFVEFRALAPTGPGGARIEFADPAASRRTKVVREGVDITGRLAGTVVVVE